MVKFLVPITYLPVITDILNYVTYSICSPTKTASTVITKIAN